MKLKYNLSLFELMDFFCDTGQSHQGFSAEEVKAAEIRLGVSLPFMYRDFLLTYGKDPVTTKNNQLIPPDELYIRCDEEEYIILWHGNPFVWIAGYLKKDLLDEVPDPPVFLNFCDGEEPCSFTKCADDTEAFLFIMLRDAACGWHGGERLKKQAEIECALSNAGIDIRRLQIPDRSGTCLDGERLYFYFESGSSRELRIAYRTVPERKAAGHLGETVKIKEKRRSKVTVSSDVSSAVAFSFGADSWLNYEPRRAVSKYYESKELEMRPKPQDGIALHPWIAWMIQRNFNHKPLTAYDWSKDIARMKSLEISPGFSNAMSEDEESIYFWEPGYLPLPAPYYYDLHDWSVIGRMKKLQSLVIKGVYIDDFSFLSGCKNLKRLKLYKTNFSDCRLLSGLTNLREVHLIFCDLEHTEVLQNLPVRCCTQGTFDLHPELKVKAVPAISKKKIIDRDIEALLKSDFCCFEIGKYLLEITFSAGRAAFIKYTDKTNVYYYDNGSGNHSPVSLAIGECPEERMMCYDGRAIRNIVYYFCCTGGWNHEYILMVEKTDHSV